MDLSAKKCVPCHSSDKPLEGKELDSYKQLVPTWQLVDQALLKSFSFKNFADALQFVNKIAVIAEEEGHHPDIFLAWGKVTVKLFTHKIKGLSQNDFILAAKIDAITP